jgi:hypothetical protein
MTDPTAFDAHAYVAACAPAVGLTLDDARRQAVAEALALVARIGAPALAVALDPDDEFAPIFTA